MDYAVAREDLEGVRELIDLDVNIVDGCNRCGDAPLIEAAKFKHREIFDRLIRCGAEVNCRASYDNWTPLHWASFRGWNNQVQLILEKGANPNASANDGDTPLILAVKIGHKEVFDVLIQYGAEVNCVSDRDGWTPLHWASCRGCVDQVRLILEKGADPNATTNDGDTPIILAGESGHREVFDVLIQYGTEVNCGIDYNNFTPLHWACFRGWVDQVRIILEKRADPNAVGKYGGMPIIPLRLAAVKGLKDIFVLLFQYGATMEFDNALSKHSFVEVVFKDVNVCTQSIVNKFHCLSLPTLYRNPDIAKKLPVLKNLKLKDQQTQEIAKFVEFEVETKKLCNIFNSQPIVLMLLCVQALLSHHST